MSEYIPSQLRKLVIARAKQICEYCLLPEKFSFFKFHIDHIISLKHGGETVEENLAYSCSIYNENKGSDIATILEDPRKAILLFNPRQDTWQNHFGILETGEIIPKTPTGAATIKILNLNHPESLIERRGLMQLGLFPVR